MSKESRIKKNEQRIARKNSTSKPPAEPVPRKENPPPVINFRRRNRRLNKRFIITLAIWVIALIVALYFLTR